MAIVLKGVDGLPCLDKFWLPRSPGRRNGSGRVAGTGATLSPALLAIPVPTTRLRSEYYEQADASYTQIDGLLLQGIHDFEQIRRCKEDSLARQSWCSKEH
jgi:hypothetical protein